MSDRFRRTGSSRDAAEAAFKAATTKPVPLVQAAAVAAPRPTAPGAKETVSLRLDRDVLEHFQAEGRGWQDAVNAALRKAAGLA